MRAEGGVIISAEEHAFQPSLELRIVPKGRLALAGELLEVELGDATFDASFAVLTNDPPLARAALDEKARAALVGAAVWTYSVTGGRLEALHEGTPARDAVVVAATRACAALSRSAARVVRRWRKRAASLGRVVEPNDETIVACVAVDDKARIELHIESAAASFTRVRLDTPQPPRHRCRIGSADGAGWEVAGPREIPEPLRQRIAQLGVLQLEADDRGVRIDVCDLCPSREDLEEMVTLAEALAGEHQRGYR